ncbi:MAG: alkyl hydroperoxide reductase [Spongiibacteraceae bacterium]|nr:alkyl hydroperoxide reductase [Spongiibacteraceae bacterium]|tara:strand:+ start:2742 stop:3230 length:489 start_codon:yes stop_codon:yes gene_type:complete
MQHQPPAKNPYTPAPAINASQWINSERKNISAMRGKVIVLSFFQMLCPGCAAHSIPQSKKIHELYRSQDVQLIGIHSVFEHHDVMTPAALKVFAHEYKLKYPIAIDRASPHGVVPCTMSAYDIQGTPSLVLIDRKGHVRYSYFGMLEDMLLGSMIGQLLAES